jgi:hypothetical protein
MVCGFLHEHFANLVGMASAPVFQLRALNPLVEGPQGWAAMDLEVDPLIHVPGEGKIHREDEVPTKTRAILCFGLRSALSISPGMIVRSRVLVSA